MKPILFSIGEFNVYGYGLMLALAVVAAFVVSMIRAKFFYKTNPDLLFNAGLVGIIFGLIGAKLTYWIVEIKAVIANPKMLLDLGGGFVVYGGIILGVLMPVLYLKLIKKERALPLLDLAMPAISLGQAIGRVGCLLAGCCYGAEAPEGSWFAITFPAGAEAPVGIPLYPTQIMSSVGNLLLFAFLLIYTNRERFAGEVVSFYMVLYAIGRFVVECFRADPRGNVGALSTSQFISIFMFAGGIALWIILKKKNYAPIRKLGRYVPEVPAPKVKEAAPETVEETKIEETAEPAEAEAQPVTEEKKETEN